MKQVLVSIALCTYNGQKYLAEQIESLLNQSYQHFEVIIVDDCSTDGTFAIATDFATRDARIKCFANDVNLGFNKNFEKALNLCTGDFIAICDQDDIWEPNKIQVLLDAIGDNWMVYSNSVFMSADGKTFGRKLLENVNLPGKDYKALLLNNYISGHTAMFSREFLSYILPFPEQGFYDWWMGFIALYHGRLAFADEVLTKYRQHELAATNDTRLSKREIKRMYFSRMLIQLEVFLTYPNLKKDDRDYINNLNNAFKLKLTKTFSAPLFKIIAADYHLLFPFQKALKNLAKITFAIKFSMAQRA
jgi:glycosyltransferase involved in cell wall biosynthesis